MGIYISLIVLISSLWAWSFITRVSGGDANRVERIANGTIGLATTLVLAFRSDRIGVDLQNYEEHFRQLTIGGGLREFELGYELLTRLVLIGFGANFQALIVLAAILSVVPVVLCIGRCSRNVYLSWLLYMGLGFYSFLFSGLRQGIALGLCLLAYSFLVRSRPVWAVCWILVAASFHVTAIAFLPVVVIRLVRLRTSSVLMISSASVLVWIFREPIYILFGHILQGAAKVTVSDAYTWMGFSMATYLLTCVVYRSVAQQDSISLGLYPIVLVGVLLMMFATVGDNAMRLANYYHQFVVLLVPNALSAIRSGPLRSWFGVCCGVSSVGLFVMTVSTQAYSIVPYYPFWRG